MRRGKKNILLWKLILILAIILAIGILLELSFISQKSEKIVSFSQNKYLNEQSNSEDNGNIAMPEPADVNYSYNFLLSTDESAWVRQGYHIPATVYLNTNHYFNSNEVENRYYMKVSDVEEYIKKTGFNNNEEIVGKHIFVTNRTEAEWYNLYVGSGIVRVDGVNYIPLNTVEEAGTVNTINMFYFPNNTITEENSPISYYDQTVINKETLYSISIVENGTLVDKEYVPIGQNYKKELKNLNDVYKWQIVGKNGEKIEISNKTAEIPSVNCSYEIMNIVDNNFYYIKYDVNNEYNVTVKENTENFIDKINQSSLTEYNVLDLLAHEYVDSKNRDKNIYEFDGWIVNGNSNYIINPNEKFTEEFLNGAISNNIITLKANWKKVDPDLVANFYIDLTATYAVVEEDDEKDLQVNTNKSYFTKSQYITRLEEYPEDMFDYLTSKSSSKYFEYFDDIKQYTTNGLYNDTSKYNKEINNKIRDLATKGHNIIDGDESSKIRINSFPTDEEIFNNIRNDEQNYKVYLNGKELSIDYLTTEYFFIDWYVFKYYSGTERTWHVDGGVVFKGNSKEFEDFVENPPEKKPDPKPENPEKPIEKTEEETKPNKPNTVETSTSSVAPSNSSVAEIKKSILPDTGMKVIPIIIVIVAGIIFIIFGNMLNRKPKRKMHNY